MNKSPEEYANELIEKYMQLKQIETLGWSGMNAKMAIQCTINDVNNTIEALTELKFNYNYPTITYYTEVLNILKSKL